MKTGLVIGGGGSKGAFAVGAVEALHDAGIEFDVIAGTSTGALLAPMISISDWKSMVEHYTEITRRDVIRYNWRGLFWRGLFHTRPLEKRIRRWAKQNYRKLMNSDKRVIVCAVSLQDKTASYFSQEGDDLAEGWGSEDAFCRVVLGSSVQPFIMPPVDFGRSQWVDGGVREIAPLDVVIKSGAERIFVIVHSMENPAPSNSRYKNLFSIGARTIDLMTDEIVLNDVLRTECYNKALGHGAKMDKRHIDITVIRPAEALADGLSFDPDTMEKMREKGHLVARAALGVQQ